MSEHRDSLKNRNLVSRETSLSSFLLAQAQARLVTEGSHVLSNIELLALLIPASGPQSSPDLAAGLLQKFGSLRRLLVATRVETAAAGLPDRAHVVLQAALEVTKRHYQELMVDAPLLDRPLAVREFLRARLRDLPHEMFAVIFLDVRGRVLKFSELFRGTLDGANVHPREVVKEALAVGAAAVILAHNHPSGNPEASESDRAITQRLQAALATVDICVTDHLIVAAHEIISLAERGLL